MEEVQEVARELLRWGISFLLSMAAVGIAVRGIWAQINIFLGGGEREMASLIKWLLSMIALLLLAFFASPLSQGLIDAFRGR